MDHSSTYPVPALLVKDFLASPSLPRKLSQLPAVDMQKLPRSFCCYFNISTRVIQPSFAAQSLCILHSDHAKTSTYANRWSSWLKHAAYQMQAVQPVFFCSASSSCLVEHSFYSAADVYSSGRGRLKPIKIEQCVSSNVWLKEGIKVSGSFDKAQINGKTYT
ncbi:hypothetical protein VP01_3336g3 [Puccinia sorghi]|uniref:HAT C-terminal dimerisation domain-containing protein n=1 Tax=Puccinia sorghi TaxID=27349 RepID=A0A0L6UY09_9BASI|nr:hypothetical protein VP01_3336g3 [Puccinia sorghi]